jgi:branched-chain amino acid transport system substrate-binding protein
VTGYPWDEITDPRHKAFVDAYRARFKDTPRLGSLLGYMVLSMIRDTIERAGSVETDALVKAFTDAKFDTVIGPVTMRGIDHQATMGAWVGKLVLKGAAGRMTDWTYVDGTSFLPTEAEVKAVRKE